MADLTNLNSYLEGPYAPVRDERTDLDLKVTGAIPDEISGLYLQNNPNPRHAPVGAYHWFDGDGMVHGVHLQGGRASYRNRWIQTAGLAADDAAGRSLTPGILMPFDPANPAPDKNTANTDLVYWNGRVLALWWLGGAPYQLSIPGLDTVGPTDLGGTLTCGMAAHPKVDPVTGELIFFDYDVYRSPHLTVAVANAEGQVTHCNPINVTGPSLFHDIAITANHTVLMDFPMTWRRDALAAGKRRVAFDPEAPARFGILPRYGTDADVRWFEAPACYCYHTTNAWEEERPDGTVVHLLACRIDNPVPRLPHDAEPTIPRLYFLRMNPFLTHWTFHLGTGAVTEEQLDDTPTEFQRTNNDLLGRYSRYGYHPRIAKEPTLLFDGCLKYDLEGPSMSHDYGAGCVGGETVFVPRAGGTEQDDGWVMTYVTDRREGSSELRILDARDLSTTARVHLPRRVPVGFHAHWAPLEA